MNFFNFCDHRLNPSASTSAVNAEGYEVNNLVSDDMIKRHKGFMVYHTINPPVDIYFNFMCKININHVVIWPQVGSQKSVGFQLFTSADYSPDKSDLSFVNVGTGFLQNEPGIVFYNNVEPSNSEINNFLCRKLFSKRNSLSAVLSLQIRVCRTYQSSVPAVKKIEVWGLPSASCPKEVRAKILSLWNRKDKVTSNFLHQRKGEETKEVELRSRAKVIGSSGLEIPEDFLDAITYEIMVLPFTLPCGKVIDKTTLEKHENHEANWGRHPSDPFTGMVYTNFSKPIFDFSLKSRIDKFLINHSDFDEIKKVPRTVGRISQLNNICVGEPFRDFSTACNSVSIEQKPLYSIMKTAESTSHALKNKSSDDKVAENPKKKVKLLDEASSSTVKLDIGCFKDDTEKTHQNQPICSHEDALNDSLDTALKNALSCLPTFTNFNQAINVTDNKCSCGGKELLYILDCQHFICRMCLTKQTKEKNGICVICNSIFDSTAPKRYHS